MAVSAQQTVSTPEQYLALERRATVKSEYVNGHIFAMAGASRRHNQITFNIAVALGLQLKRRSCVAYTSDMRVKVAVTGLYTYPDVVVTCDKPVFEDVFVDTLLNPAVIIEVLLNSAEGYDRGAKFAHYRRLPSLKEYCLVSQDRVCVEHYARQMHRWLLTETSAFDDVLQLHAIDCELNIADVYDKVDFPDTILTNYPLS